jgi:hypothetical protein
MKFKSFLIKLFNIFKRDLPSAVNIIWIPGYILKKRGENFSHKQA